MKLQRLRWMLVAFGFLSFALLVGSTLARPEDRGTHGAFAKLQSRATSQLDVHWNVTTDIPDFITSKTTTGRIPYTPSAAERGNPVAIARGFLDENRALFNLTSAADDLTPLRVEGDQQLGYAHVRLAQTYHGLPVFGRQLVVHLDPREQIVAVNGHFAPQINVATQPSITQADAERVALQDLMQEQFDARERETVSTEVLRDQIRLMVYVDEHGKATLTWNVIILTDSPIGQWMYFVNAGRPVVVHAFDSAEHIKQRRTYTADNKTNIPGRILIEEGERSKDDVANTAHDSAGKVYDYYFNTFKRDGIDGQGSPMVSTVHYGSSTEDAQNAAWIGQRQQMIYGDGGRIFKPLALGLDVVGHEFTHGVTDSSAQLVYEGQSGALNESYSDVFAAMIDRANWTIGETVIKSPPFPVPYLRNMEDPSAGGRYDASDPLRSVGQPSTMSEYANLPNSRKSDNGGVHVNSGIPNRVAFLIGQALGREKTEQIYYRTLTQYLTPDSDFAAAARASMRAATDLFGASEANAVRDAWTQVGLNPGGTSNQPPSQTPRATPTPSRNTPVPQPPQTASGCANIIVNGGFEADGGWIEVTASHASIIDTELPHSGSRSAWLGGSDEENLQYIYQDVSIPANATSVKLNYWRLVHEEKKGVVTAGVADAKFWTVIAKSNGDVLATVEQFISKQGDDNWAQGQFDLSQFAGKQVRVAYIAENPKNNISSYFVDDVELLACTTGEPSQQPPPAVANDVAITGIVKNADTGRGIEGAQFFVLKAGLSASDAAEDDTVTDDEVLTFGVSDANGLYQTDAIVPRGQTYSVIVIARGYRPIVADSGIKLPADAKNPYTVNATLKPSR